MDKIWIRDGTKSDPGSGINIPDPQHCPHYILKYVPARGMRQAWRRWPVGWRPRALYSGNTYFNQCSGSINSHTNLDLALLLKMPTKIRILLIFCFLLTADPRCPKTYISSGSGSEKLCTTDPDSPTHTPGNHTQPQCYLSGHWVYPCFLTTLYYIIIPPADYGSLEHR